VDQGKAPETCAPRGSQQQLLADFEDYLNWFSPNVQDIIENEDFRRFVGDMVYALTRL
jgi:type I restriction enzyme M protein